MLPEEFDTMVGKHLAGQRILENHNRVCDLPTKAFGMSQLD